MKKTFMLVAAIALLAAPVFAEITVSGQVEFVYEHELSDNEAYDTYEDDDANSISFDLGIEIGEFTTLNTALAADMEDDDGQSSVYLDGWSVTQDVTGALGVDGPITFSVEMGDVSFSGTQYTDEFDALTSFDDEDQIYGEDMDGGAVDFTFAIGIMDMVTVELGFFPATFADSITNNDSDGTDDTDDTADDETATDVLADQFGINIYGVFGPVSLATYLVVSDGDMDMEINGLLDFAPVEVGFQLQIVEMEDDNALFYEDDGVTLLGLSAMDMQSYVYVTYTSDFGLEATVEYFGYTMINNFDMEFAVDAEYEIAVGSATVDANWGAFDMLSDLDMEIGVGVSYPVSDAVELHAGYDIVYLLTDIANSMEINIGSDLEIGAMSYSVDYTLETEDSDNGDELQHTVAFYGAVSF